MKKKLLPLLLVAAILFSLAACGSPAPVAATPAPSTPTPSPTPQPTPEMNMTAQLKNVSITIVGAELSERSGVAQLRLYYDCTNTSAKILSPLYGFETERTAFQNDEELSSNIYELDNVSEYSKYAPLLSPRSSPSPSLYSSPRRRTSPIGWAIKAWRPISTPISPRRKSTLRC